MQLIKCRWAILKPICVVSLRYLGFYYIRTFGQIILYKTTVLLAFLRTELYFSWLYNLFLFYCLLKKLLISLINQLKKDHCENGGTRNCPVRNRLYKYSNGQIDLAKMDWESLIDTYLKDNGKNGVYVEDQKTRPADLSISPCSLDRKTFRLQGSIYSDKSWL